MTLAEMIRAAADLWAGADGTEFAGNPEYLRGQAELIRAVLHLSAYVDDPDDLLDKIMGAIIEQSRTDSSALIDLYATLDAREGRA